MSHSLGVPPQRLLLIAQVHGTAVAIARAGDASHWSRPQADAIATDDPSIAIGVRVADCAPVLLVEPVRRVVAAVHAGWRGTASQIVSKAVETLREVWGVDPTDLRAAIGPCLSACCGEVGPEVRDAFAAGGASETQLSAWFTRGERDRWLLDLPRANHDQLIAAGLSRDRLWTAGLCTRSHADRLHSYRAAGPGAGRMLAAIRLP